MVKGIHLYTSVVLVNHNHTKITLYSVQYNGTIYTQTPTTRMSLIHQYQLEKVKPNPNVASQAKQHYYTGVKIPAICYMYIVRVLELHVSHS